MNDLVQLIGLGELLWDCFPDRRLPGGAPANVAFHAQQLGLSAAVATRVGRDELGDELITYLENANLRTDLVQRDPSHPTGTVSVTPHSATGSSYSFLDNSAWDHIAPTNELMSAVQNAQALCFGTLAQRRPDSRNTVHRCLQGANKDCLIVYDVNLRPPFFARDWIAKSFKRSTIIKVNDDEVRTLSQVFEFGPLDDAQFATKLLEEYPQLILVCVTRGANGCVGVSREDVFDLPGIRIKVADTVGAGDAFTAGIVYGQLQKWSTIKTLDFANQFGTLVAGRHGAMPLLTDELESLKTLFEWSYRDTTEA
jgi:fructokinase